MICPFLLVKLQTGGLYLILSYTGETDVEMNPGKAIMIIYPDT